MSPAPPWPGRTFSAARPSGSPPVGPRLYDNPAPPGRSARGDRGVGQAALLRALVLLVFFLEDVPDLAFVSVPAVPFVPLALVVPPVVASAFSASVFSASAFCVAPCPFRPPGPPRPVSSL